MPRITKAMREVYGQHYHICNECDRLFIAPTTDQPYLVDSATNGDWKSSVPSLESPYPECCGCDGTYGREDKVCDDCARDLERQAEYDARDSDRYGDYDYDFADPGGRSALRAEVGGENGHCPGCRKRTGKTDHFCRHCGHELNPRAHDCPTCGAKGVLTDRDVELRYQCDVCADRAEGIYVGADY